jgi:alpha-glucosidase (family GH31 glycosyl hydrolase)
MRNFIVCFFLAGLLQCGAAAQQPYSQSPEYRGMLDELHRPAPSPVYLATGRHIAADTALKAAIVQESAQQVVARTASLEMQLADGSLLLRNLANGTEWKVALGSRQSWSRGTGFEWQSGAANVRLMNERLVCVSLAGAQDSTQLEVTADEPFYGLGERFDSANQADQNVLLQPMDTFGPLASNRPPGRHWSYVTVPLLYSASGMGLFADTGFISRFAISHSGFAVETKGAPVDYYFFVEPDGRSVLGSYTALTGRAPAPEPWTFGPWLNALQGSDAVFNLADRLRKEQIPSSALWVFDMMDEQANLGWPLWSFGYYGDPARFTGELHKRGFRVLTYVHPYLRERLLPYPNLSAAYAKGVRDGLYVMGADGRPSGPRFEVVPTANIDFTNPKAVDWWQQMMTETVHQGFDGWMEDFGEWIRADDRLAAGTGKTLSTLNPLLYHKVTRRITNALNPHLVTFSRSGSIGSQQFSPVLWGGDQSPDWSDYGLPSVVTAGITAGLVGFSNWGPDILSSGDSKELWMRWCEFGALTPVMRDHLWDKPVGAIDMWHDADTTETFRRYARLHTALLPFWMTYAAEAEQTGIPILRHLMLEYPADPQATHAEHQYLLGRELLVAPVIEQGATTRTLYAPAGEWVDYWTGDRYTGGREVTVPAPVERIPLLARAGSLLPMLPEDQTPAWDWNDPRPVHGKLVWRVFEADAPFQSHFRLTDGTTAEWSRSGSIERLSGDGAAALDYEVVIASRQQPPATLRLDGRDLTRLPTPAPGTAEGWWWDAPTRSVHAAFHAQNFDLELPVEEVKQ